MFIWMLLLTGVLYPLVMTGIAQLSMGKQANGTLVYYNLKPVGSALIGQRFEKGHYFWPRPSFIDYNPLPSGASNWGPTSRPLKESVEKRAKIIGNSPLKIPSELLFASGSGLDPHISPECASFQVERIAKERRIESEKIYDLIAEHTERRYIGFLGPLYVNVLKLNIALDNMAQITDNSGTGTHTGTGTM